MSAPHFYAPEKVPVEATQAKNRLAYSCTELLRQLEKFEQVFKAECGNITRENASRKEQETVAKVSTLLVGFDHLPTALVDLRRELTNSATLEAGIRERTEDAQRNHKAKVKITQRYFKQELAEAEELVEENTGERLASAVNGLVNVARQLEGLDDHLDDDKRKRLVELARLAGTLKNDPRQSTVDAFLELLY